MGPATKLLGLQLACGVALLPYAGSRGSAATAAQQQPERRRLGLAPGAELGFHVGQAAEKARAATAREGHTQGPAGCPPLGAGAGNGSPALLTGQAAVVGARGEATSATAGRGSNGRQAAVTRDERGRLTAGDCCSGPWRSLLYSAARGEQRHRPPPRSPLIGRCGASQPPPPSPRRFPLAAAQSLLASGGEPTVREGPAHRGRGVV